MVNYSLSSACDIENFSSMASNFSNANFNQNMDPRVTQPPVTPMPTNPPNFNENEYKTSTVDGDNYKWKSMNSAISNMTEASSFNSYKPLANKGTCDFQQTEFGRDFDPRVNNQFPPPSNDFANNVNKQVCNEVRKEWSNPVPPQLRDEYEAQLNKVDQQLKYPIQYTKEDTEDHPPVLKKKIRENLENMPREIVKNGKNGYEMRPLYVTIIVFVVLFFVAFFYRKVR